MLNAGLSHSNSAAGDALIAGRGLILHREGRRILDHVDIAVHSDEIVTLIGLNGAGKSTLVRMLLGLIAPDGGRVSRRPGLRVGYVPQRMAPEATLPLTAARFLTLGGRQPAEKIHAALAEVGIADRGATGLLELSGGERRRVMLARALLRDPELLVLDEPMSGVDVAGQIELYDLIERLRDERGCGVLLVSHDLHLVMAATNRVVCLNHHVCCTGQPEVVLQNDEFKALFGDRVSSALAVYQHAHDHSHDADGQIIPLSGDGGHGHGHDRHRHHHD
jgi:zinc transport system ATP-binding protein